MPAHILRTVIAALTLLVCAAAHAEPVLVETTGYAHDIKTGDLVYTEHHRILMNGQDYQGHDVEYRDPAGAVIATKTLDYSRSRYAPAFRLDDRRDGYVEGAEYTDRGYRLFFRKSADADMQSDYVQPDDTELVTDAGFNLFMVDNMSRLQKGEKLEIDLCVAERQTSYAFRGYKSGAPEIEGRMAIQITTEPNSRLIRLLVDPLTLAFDQENSRLLLFAGATNIRRADGKRHVARIIFPAADLRISEPPL